AFFMKESGMRLLVLLQRMLDHPAGWTIETGSDATLLIGDVSAEMFKFVFPPMATLCLFGIAASVSQNAPRLTVDRIMPELSRVSPGQGFGRIFGMKGLVEFGKSTFKFLGVSIVVFMLMRAELTTLVDSMFMEPGALPELVLSLTLRLLAIVAIV